jgi:uncharacterized protein (TIGR02266 family)
VESARKILIVDDTAMFRELGSLFLARSGEVLTARDAAEGLAVARREQPDVVVVDLNMPGMDGDVFCKVIRSDARLRKTPIILLIASDSADDRARAVRAGADDVISKPISRMSLIQSVNRFLRGGPVRGQARVVCEARVQIRHAELERWGTARNLSRGGIFVEADAAMPPGSEVSLQFALPDTALHFAPTAQVVWLREPDNGHPPGMGLRFLALDRASAEQIDAFVYENAPLPEPQPALAAGGPQ